MVVFRILKEGYVKILYVDPMEANTRIFHPSFSFLLFPTSVPVTFSRQIPHGADRLDMAPPRRWPRCPPGLAIRTLNIRYGGGFGMEQAIQELELRGFDVMMLTETKIQLKVYLHNCLGYNVT